MKTARSFNITDTKFEDTNGIRVKRMQEGGEFVIERTELVGSGKTQIYNDNSRGRIVGCTIAGIEAAARTCDEESGMVLDGEDSL